MPHIIVTADETIETGERQVTLWERVSRADFKSEHFAWRLVERLGWGSETRLNSSTGARGAPRATNPPLVSSARPRS
jgi:hypothetical protein